MEDERRQQEVFRWERGEGRGEERKDKRRQQEVFRWERWGGKGEGDGGQEEAAGSVQVGEVGKEGGRRWRSRKGAR